MKKSIIVALIVLTSALTSCADTKEQNTVPEVTVVSTGSVVSAEPLKKHVILTMNDRFEQACRSVDGEIKQMVTENGWMHPAEYSTWYSDGCFDKDEQNIDTKALENIPKEITFKNTPEEEKACRDIKVQYDVYDKLAFPDGKNRSTTVNENVFANQFKHSLDFVQKDVEKDYWKETDALDYVATLSDHDRFIDLEAGFSYAEANAKKCDIDCVYAGSGGVKTFDIAVWKSEPIGKECAIVLVKRGDKPMASKYNFTIATVRLSDANLTAKLLDGMVELNKDVQNWIDSEIKHQKTLKSLGITE